MGKVMSELWPIAQLSRTFKDMPSPLISYRRARNLRDILVTARVNRTPKVQHPESTRNITNYVTKTTNLKTPTIRHCRYARCKTCKSIEIGAKEFTSNITNKQFKLRDSMDCNSANVVYLITCTRCMMQYCGECSTPLKIRMANHRYSIRKGLDLPVAKHFNRPKHTLNDMKVMPIEKIKNDDKNKRKQREAFWIYELRTLSPEGVNVLDSINLN